VLFLFAPGAGAPSSSSWMRAWAARLKTLGAVCTFDYPYRLAGRNAPDRLPVLIAAHRQALRQARDDHGDGPVFLVGKSMGSRVGCHVSLEEAVEGVICLGYPLKGSGKMGAVRDAVLKEMRTRVLFVQGTRDALCPLDRLEATRREMIAESMLHIVEGGDHSLIVGQRELKARGRTQSDVDADIVQVIGRFVAVGRDRAGATLSGLEPS
jgi:predicted alpha/beta-hydrolase family hydrolase